MTFASPWTAIIAAAVALPLLLLLYFLKLRRQTAFIASTFLWEKSVEDLQVNAPFQRLRTSLLLLLQVLLLTLLLLALAEPIIDAPKTGAARVILIVDHSASMQATDADATGSTRLDAARTKAREIIESLGRPGGPEEIMLITFARTASVLVGFETDRRRLLEALDAVRTSDEEADLRAAFRLASAFATSAEDAADVPPDVVLLSDGGVGGPEVLDDLTVRAGTVRFEACGPDETTPIRNLGVASFSARRELEDPTTAVAFVRLLNAGPETVGALLTLEVRRLDDVTTGDLAATPAVTFPRTVSVPPATDVGPGEAVESFRFEASEGTLLQISHRVPDALPSDDVAALVLPPPPALRIAYVQPGDGGDPFLLNALEDTEPREIRPFSPETFAALDGRQLDSGLLYDFVVFDRVAPDRLPGVPSLTVGATPAGVTVTPPATTGARRILSWNRDAAVMRYVTLDGLRYRGFGGLDLPSGSVALATGPDGAVIARLRARGVFHVVVGFDLFLSNWPRDISFAIFVQNVLDVIAQGGRVDEGRPDRPGDPITVRTHPTARELTVSGPETATRPVEGGVAATLPVLRRVGVYRVDGAMPPRDLIAVSMVSDVESDLRMRTDLRINAEVTRANRGAVTAPRELWPYLLASALVVLVIEWLFYCWRMRRG